MGFDTPTTTEIRSLYDSPTSATSRQAFDRWLAAHDAEQRAAEREACARVAEAERPESGSQILPSEYRTGKIDASKIITAAIRARTA